MSEPIQRCLTCDRQRRCYRHMRAEFPPDAAKRWLRRTCPRDGKPCEIRYRAGWQPGGRYVAQGHRQDDGRETT